VFKPQPAGDLTWVEGSFETPRGLAASRWDKTNEAFTLTVEVPANTTAEVWVPTDGDQAVLTPKRATFERIDGEFAVYSVGAGRFTFVAAAEGYAALEAAVEAQLASGDLSEQLAENLVMFIGKAREASAEGKAQAADSALRSFLNQIGNANAKRASDEAKAELTEIAEQLQALLRAEGGIPVER